MGLWVVLRTPLVLNETVTAQQDFPACKVSGAPTAPAKVGSTAPVPPPVVLEPLCAGQTSGTLTDYTPGARIEIFQNGVSLGIAQPPQDAAFAFPLPPLLAPDA